MGLLDTFVQSIKDLNPEWTKDRMKTAGGLLADFTPVVGDVKSVYDGVQSAKKGDYLGAALGAVGAIPLVPNVAGMFIGKGAKTWDAVMASKALEMEKAGVDHRVIWKETGNWKGPDGKWRQEIPDNNVPQKMYLTQDALLDYPKIKDSLPHKQLYKAYPETSEIRLAPVIGKENGHFDEAQNVIGLKPINKGDTTPEASRALTSTQLHELQHAIQQREGFARGGSPEMMQKELNRASVLERHYSLANALAKSAEKDFGGDLDKAAKWFADMGFGVNKEHIETIMRDGASRVSRLADAYSKKANEFGVHKQFGTSGDDLYRRLAGEAEARATQARMNMDAAQRRATFPADSYDVPLDQLIIRGLLQ